jgi:hypothetical protein
VAIKMPKYRLFIRNPPIRIYFEGVIRISTLGMSNLYIEELIYTQ